MLLLRQKNCSKILSKADKIERKTILCDKRSIEKIINTKGATISLPLLYL